MRPIQPRAYGLKTETEFHEGGRRHEGAGARRRDPVPVRGGQR